MPCRAYYKRLHSFLGNVLRYGIHSSQQKIDFPIPKGPVTGVVTLRDGKRVARALQVAQDENWIPEHGLSLHFGEKLPEQLPTNPTRVLSGSGIPLANLAR